ncbi:hypothetical protein ASF62_05815 [Leifsonia sp. Leaf325]|nr:hypothetical protein ASF62_05815 [Leifsonia sp. Leaf325]
MAVKTERTVPIRLEVLRRERISPSFVRITLGGGEVDRFTYKGFDQWFRLFVPPTDAAELVLPNRDGWGGYAQLLTTRKDLRPTMRNYTVRAYRAGGEGASGSGGAEIDVDFVLHEGESGEVEGIAAGWAQSCSPGDEVGLLDEGYGYDPRPGTDWHLLVTDETGLPAIAGICGSLPADARGLAVIEVPLAADVQEFAKPDGVEVVWLPRAESTPEVATDAVSSTGSHAGAHARVRIAALAYAATVAAELPVVESVGPVMHSYAVGEQALATGIRRHLVADRDWDKTAVSFCGYWRLPKGADPIDSAVPAASVTV